RCSYHRRNVIKEIREIRRYKKSKRIAVVSTSILEAGIDISFPVVYRMVAPLDSVVQAAGRCNRHSDDKMGRLILFKLKEEQLYNEQFEAGIRLVKKVIEEKGISSMKTESSFIRYYKIMLHQTDLNKKDINDYLMFRCISSEFKMIEDYRQSVLCPMVKEFNKKWLTEKRTRIWWEKVKPFMVLIPKNLN